MGAATEFFLWTEALRGVGAEVDGLDSPFSLVLSLDDFMSSLMETLRCILCFLDGVFDSSSVAWFFNLSGFFT